MTMACSLVTFFASAVRVIRVDQAWCRPGSDLLSRATCVRTPNLCAAHELFAIGPLAGGYAMGIFGNIMSSIFGSHASAQSAPSSAPASNRGAGAGQSPPLAPGSTTGSAPGGSVDVNAVLTERAAKKKE